MEGRSVKTGLVGLCIAVCLLGSSLPAYAAGDGTETDDTTFAQVWSFPTFTVDTSGCWSGSVFVTFTQGGWGARAQLSLPCWPGTVRDALFPSVFPAGVTIGDPPNGSATFTTSQAVEDFLPAAGTFSQPLIGGSIDPQTTSAGVFAGQVLALQLNVGFSDAYSGCSGGTGSDLCFPLGFGDMLLGNPIITPSLSNTPGLIGKSVREFLAIANTALGGGLTPYSVSALNTIADELNRSYLDGNRPCRTRRRRCCPRCRRIRRWRLLRRRVRR